MSENHVSDLITDQERTFALLVLSGTMTDREAAQNAGLNPDTAANTKAKPQVCAYMAEHRARLEQQLAARQAEALHRLNLEREQILTRLWQLANLSPESTRNNISCQIKAMAMIVAIHGVIPAPRAASSAKPPAPSLPPEIYAAEWLHKQQAEAAGPRPAPAPAQPQPAPAPPAGAPPLFDPANLFRSRPIVPGAPELRFDTPLQTPVPLDKIPPSRWPRRR